LKEVGQQYRGVFGDKGNNSTSYGQSDGASGTGIAGISVGFGQGIGKDIAKIQPCRMPALAIEAIGVARDGEKTSCFGEGG